MFLPYRLHLAAHILKDTVIIFLCLLPFILRAWWSLPIGFVLAGFRVPALPAMLVSRFIPMNTRIVIGFLVLTIAIVSSVGVVREFILARSEADMMGRDFFNVILHDANSIGTIILKSVLWPILYKTGGYALSSPSAILFGLALEQIVMLALVIRGGFAKDYLLGRGMVTLVVYALIVNSFGAYYRYGYAFFMLDCMIIAQLWNARFGHFLNMGLRSDRREMLSTSARPAG
ncbi:MAG: hypothetical protein MUF41_07115 [Sphingopyxis sp.]|nr:hypothetical protein [Sphingopyxis sp.]